MTDIREGVTPVQHEVLNLIEQNAEEWGNHHAWDDQLSIALALVRSCNPEVSALSFIRENLIYAAARLIDAATEIERMIAAGDV